MDSFDTNSPEGTRRKDLSRQIHRTLAQSYMFFFLTFLAGIFVNVFYPIKMFQDSLALYFGFVFLVLASVLIFWAQYTSSKLEHESPTMEHFCQGPYCITRSPTHWGLLFLLLAFGAIINSLVVVGFAIFAFIVTKSYYLRREEAALVEKYGAPYREYLKKVRL